MKMRLEYLSGRLHSSRVIPLRLGSQRRKWEYASWPIFEWLGEVARKNGPFSLIAPDRRYGGHIVTLHFQHRSCSVLSYIEKPFHRITSEDIGESSGETMAKGSQELSPCSVYMG
jgi:hypothetical protein